MDDWCDDFCVGFFGEFENLVDYVLCGLFVDFCVCDGVVLGVYVGV